MTRCVPEVCKVVDQYQWLSGWEKPPFSRLNKTSSPSPTCSYYYSPVSWIFSQKSTLSLKANPFLCHKREVWGKQHHTNSWRENIVVWRLSRWMMNWSCSLFASYTAYVDVFFVSYVRFLLGKWLKSSMKQSIWDDELQSFVLLSFLQTVFIIKCINLISSWGFLVFSYKFTFITSCDAGSCSMSVLIIFFIHAESQFSVFCDFFFLFQGGRKVGSWSKNWPAIRFDQARQWFCEVEMLLKAPTHRPDSNKRPAAFIRPLRCLSSDLFGRKVAHSSVYVLLLNIGCRWSRARNPKHENRKWRNRVQTIVASAPPTHRADSLAHCQSEWSSNS